MFIRLFKVNKDGTLNSGNPDYKEFNAEGALEFSLSKDNGYTDLPIAEQEARDNILIKLFGAKESFNIGFPITAATSDRYGGTGAGYGNTVIDQINFITKFMLTAKSDDEFGFQLIESPSTVKFSRSPGNNPKDGGIFSNLAITYDVGADKANLRITFTVGKVEGT